jgi:hypothetical protein
MTRLIVIPLFTRGGEPSAILMNDTSGEYLSLSFECWRDAVHFVIFSRTDENQDLEYDELYEKWREQYYDDEEESFTGNHNEFMNTDFGLVFVNNGPTIDSETDLITLSMWNHHN